jgi:CDP-4-dehydro-6-deoxyglucose reductase
MFNIKLKNKKSFSCDSNTTIFEAAKKQGVVLEHSCLTARCRSCMVKVLEGNTVDVQKELVLSNEEKEQNFVLSCNAKPVSNLVLDVEDLGDILLHEKRIVPSKIDTIEKVAKDIIKVVLRFPPNTNFKFISGQYVNLMKGNIKRSYSIANKSGDNSKLEFYIKKYENGLMSNYWFEEAKPNDLLRMEGPLGTFFLRESKKRNIIFLATGTGLAPVKAILEQLEDSNQDFTNKVFWLFVGARHKEDFFWEPIEIRNINLNFFPVLSRPTEDWEKDQGYVQDIVLKKDINLSDAQVYACGSNQMIESAKKLFSKNSLSEDQFYSDAFICTN